MRDREPLFCKFDLHNALENHGRKLRELSDDEFVRTSKAKLSEQVSLVDPEVVVATSMRR